jgi:hypothetical protein
MNNVMTFLKQKRRGLIIIGLLLLWIVLHLPSLMYGTSDVPLHMSYIGDEQSPVNGALHILQDKSLFAIRGLHTVYYGPFFSVIAIPAVLADAGLRFAEGYIHSATDYMHFILWDWGGIIVFARIIALVASFFSLYGFFLLLTTKTVNPRGKKWIPWLGVLLLGGNTLFFEYAGYFKHWVFVLLALSFELYYLIRIVEEPKVKKYWIMSAVWFVFGFGVSYLNSVFLCLWLPVLVLWVRRRAWNHLMMWGWYIAGIILAGIALIAWDSYPFIRLIGLQKEDLTGAAVSAFTTEGVSKGHSFLYYGSILFYDNLALLFAFITMLVATGKRWITRHWTWVPIVGGVFYFALFGALSHHESRYILPLLFCIVTAIVFLIALFADEEPQTMSSRMRRWVNILLVTCIAWSVVFNLVYTIRWSYLESKGPDERAIINTILGYEQQKPSAKTLVIASYLLGYPHTAAAYADFATRYHKSDFNLYKVLLTTDAPKYLTALNAYYVMPGTPLTASTTRGFDHVIYEYSPSQALHLEPDYLDVDLARLWYAGYVAPKYIVLQ